MSPAVAAQAVPPTFGQVAKALVGNGYRPVPLVPRQKYPSLNDWPNYRFADGDSDTWSDAGVGIITGQVVAVDIDVLNAGVAQRLLDIVVQHLGPAPVRIGRAPKKLLLYRTDQPFAKRVTHVYRLPGDAPDASGHRVEVLASGQQFVSYGIHPDTGRPYEWSNGADPLSVPEQSLRVISEAQVLALIQELNVELGKVGTPAGKLRADDGAGERKPNESLRGDPSAVRSALVAIPNADISWDDWSYIGLAVKGALGDEGFDAWEDFSARSKKNLPEETAKAWSGFKPTRIGAGTIFHIARAHGWKGATSSPPAPGTLNWQFMVYQSPSVQDEKVADTTSALGPSELVVAASAPSSPAPAGAERGGQVKADSALWGSPIVPLFPLADASAGRFLSVPPKPRIWLLKNYLPAGIVGSVIAPGGAGKSQLILQLAASVAAGVPFCNTWEVGKPGEALALLAEDDDEEVHRRLALIARQVADVHKQRDVREAIARNLYVKSVVAWNNLLTSSGAHRAVQETGYADRVVATVRDLRNLKLIVLDPASRFRGGDENSAEDVTRFIEALEKIRMATGATVLIVHHANKASMQGGEQTQSASRGSSAFSDGIRWQMNLAGLSEDEARGFGVPAGERRHYLSVTMTKNNYAPPQPTIYLKRAEGGVLVRASLDDAKNGDGVMQRIVAKIANIGAISADKFEQEYGGVKNIFGVGERAIRGYINRAIEAGWLTRPEAGRERPLSVTPLGQSVLAVLDAAGAKTTPIPGSPAKPGNALAG